MAKKHSNTTTASTDSGSFNSPVDAGSGHQITGALVSFCDKEYHTGSGLGREAMPLETELIAVATRAGWKRWQDGKVVKFVEVTDDGFYPKRGDLGDTDQTKWECGPGDEPADPWQDSREVDLVNADDYAKYTFCIASMGGRVAVDALREAMEYARRFRPGQYPIVSLQWKKWPTKHGMKSRPSLKIVGWFPPAATAASRIAAQGDLNDLIPDLSK
jgi:hypothetical protein